MLQYNKALEMQFLSWLNVNRFAFEGILKSAILEYQITQNITYDGVHESVKELAEKFRNNEDVDYSIDGIEVAYASFYNLKRCFPIIFFAIKSLVLSQEKRGTEVFDIGSGTGSGLLAFYIAYSFLSQYPDFDQKLINYHCFDTSIRMHTFSDLLYKKLREKVLPVHLKCFFYEKSWRTLSEIPHSDSDKYIVLISSFTIHSSDINKTNVDFRGKSDFAHNVETFLKFINQINVESAFLATHYNKKEFFQEIVERVKSNFRTEIKTISYQDCDSEIIFELRTEWLDEINKLSKLNYENISGLLKTKIPWYDLKESKNYNVWIIKI